MFAPEGDRCLQRAGREDAGRFSKEGKSLDDFLVLLVMQKYDKRTPSYPHKIRLSRVVYRNLAKTDGFQHFLCYAEIGGKVTGTVRI